MRKTDLTNEINNIINLYNDGTGIGRLGAMFKVDKNRIYSILNDNNITIRNVGNSSTLDITNKILNLDYNKLVPKEGYKYIVICKQTKKEFNDYLNKAGALSNHINNIYPEVIIPNNYAKKKFFILNNYYWHEQFFDLKEVPKTQTRKCNYCDWETDDIDNRAGSYEIHLKTIHNKSLINYLNEFPEDIIYHPKHKSKKDREEKLKDKDHYVTCLVCNKKLHFITSSHLKTHNMNMSDYKGNYSNKIISDSMYRINKENYRRGNENMVPTFESKPEKEIREYIDSLGFTTSKNRKLLKGGEIDILIESEKIGFEFNGNKWHTDKFGKKYSTYHVDKTKTLNDLGYKLIHIFEDEWVFNRDLVKQKISHILNVSSGIKIGARKCTINKIQFKEASEFLIKNHIQGTVNSELFYGAYYNELLIGILSFNRKRNMTKNSKTSYEWELTRFATHNDYIISGLCSKMLNNFIKEYNPQSIVSFADRRWSHHSNYNLYSKLGFNFDGFTKPSYSYYKTNIDRYRRFHKFGFGKSGLKKKGLYVEGLSEWECMQYHSWDRIWDCGLIRYVWYPKI